MTIDERGNVVWTRESDDHRLYYVGYYNASFVRSIRRYKSFYFGTLNNR